jgi:hypothetical protein
MKANLLVIIALGFSVHASACPDMSGKWECKEAKSNDTSVETIHTSGTHQTTTTDGQLTFEFEFDGKGHNFSNGLLPHMYYVGTCVGNKVITKSKGWFLIDDVTEMIETVVETKVNATTRTLVADTVTIENRKRPVRTHDVTVCKKIAE